MSDLENVYKLNRYFYMDSNQNIFKYKKYCIIVIRIIPLFTFLFTLRCCFYRSS